MATARPLGQHWTFGHQAVVAPVAPAATPTWPIIPLGILCLALTLLAIAATIVLSLIPIYTRHKSVNPQTESSPFSTTFLTANGTLPTGQLSDADRAALQAALNNFLAGNSELAGCTINLSNANVQNCPSTRRILQKRGRRRRLQQQQQQQQSSQKRIARQTAGNCVDQQISTTSTLSCPSCFAACLRKRAALLQSLLPNFAALIPFPNANQTIQVVGTNVPLSPPSSTTVTAAPGGSNTASTSAGGGSNTASTSAGGGGGSNTASTSTSTASTSTSTASTGFTTSTTTAFPGTTMMPTG